MNYDNQQDNGAGLVVSVGYSQILEPGTIANHTGGNQIAEQLPANTDGNQIAGSLPMDTGGNQIVDTGIPNHTGSDSEPVKLLDHMESDKYEPNKGSVGNMGEFFGQPGFGSDVKENSRKTSKQYQGQSIYQANQPIGNFMKKGDQFYLDNKHRNHIEVFDSTGTKVRAVLNLDGSYNQAKTDAAKAEGRRLPK